MDSLRNYLSRPNLASSIALCHPRDDLRQRGVHQLLLRWAAGHEVSVEVAVQKQQALVLAPSRSLLEQPLAHRAVGDAVALGMQHEERRAELSQPSPHPPAPHNHAVRRPRSQPVLAERQRKLPHLPHLLRVRPRKLAEVLVVWCDLGGGNERGQNPLEDSHDGGVGHHVVGDVDHGCDQDNAVENIGAQQAHGCDDSSPQ
eukprot:2118542-Rhodomonas_salina.4